MKSITYSLLLLFLCASCSKRSEIKISVSDKVLYTMQGGIGINFTNLQDSLPVVQLKNQYRSYGGSTWGANPKLTDTAAWNKIFKYADWMKLDMCRLFVTRKHFEPQKGKFDFNNSEMQYLYKYLDYCEVNNIDVFLQNYFNNVEWLAVPTAKNNPVNIIRSAPNDLEAYTDGLIKLLQYLTINKKYTCIKYLCLTNEPFENWSWYIAEFNPDRFESPEKAYKLMHEKIKKKNINIKLSGPDVSIYLSSKINPEMSIFNYFDAYDVHSYVTRFDWWKDSTMTFEDGNKGEINKISETELQYSIWSKHAKENNKPFFISEMGSFMYGFGEDNIGISTYDALLKDVESVIRYSNIGLDGFMRWSFLNRGNLDGQWESVRTWDMKNNRTYPVDSIVPQSIPYYMWGLLSRYTPKYAQILESKIENSDPNGIQTVFVCTYKDPENDKISIFIVNDGDNAKEVSINNTLKLSSLKKIIIEKSIFKDKQFGEVNLETENFNMSEKLNLPAKSLVLLTNY